jgi:hypothetical protein
MRYRDDQDVRVGDVVRIDTQYFGTVVWCEGTETGELVVEGQHWSYLRTGALIDTDFGGLVHYPNAASFADDDVVLVRHSSAA